MVESLWTMRWLLLDEITVIEKGKRVRAKSRVPEKGASPEVLMIEMMAQAGGLLIGAQTDYQEDLIFAKIEDAEFHQPLELGAPIEIEATSDAIKPAGGWIDAVIRNQGKPLAKARLLLMNVGPLRPETREPVSFHRAFMDYFKVREKVT